MEGKKILLVDDDVDLVMSMKAYLSSRGYQITTAHNSKDGYKRITESRPDLIVLDVMMDYDEEGMVFASALKTDGPTRDIPVIILSGFNVDKATRDKVMASLMGQNFPADSFMQKPVRLAELVTRIEALLEAEEKRRNRRPEEEP